MLEFLCRCPYGLEIFNEFEPLCGRSSYSSCVSEWAKGCLAPAGHIEHLRVTDGTHSQGLVWEKSSKAALVPWNAVPLA